MADKEIQLYSLDTPKYVKLGPLTFILALIPVAPLHQAIHAMRTC
jgi:hypothetical protein